MASRAARKKAAASAAAAAPPTQLQDLCFNTHGHAFRHPEEHRTVPLYIVARTPVMQAYKPIFEKGNKPKSRLAIPLTKEETSTQPSATHAVYLFVGWVPQNVTEAQLKNAKTEGVSRQNPMGTIAPDPNGILEPKEEELPLMAVVKTCNGDVDPAKRPALQSFVLLAQKNGLCTPYMVSQDHIFYLPQFRDNTNNFKARGKAWNDLVAKQAVLAVESTSTARRVQLSKKRDQARFAVGPTASFRNEVLTLATSYQLSDKVEFLNELQDILEDVDNDVRYVPLSQPNSHRFVDAATDTTTEDEVFTIEHAKGMIRELEVCWPEVHATADFILLLQQGMTAREVCVDYHLLKPFLNEGIHKLRSAKIDSDNVQAAAIIAEESLNTVKRILGTPNPPTAVPEDPYRRMFRAIRNKLQEMIDADEKFATMLKDAAGDAGLAANFQDIWGTYSEGLDTDTTRKAFEEVVRLLVVAFRQKEATLASKIKELVDRMDEAGLS